MKVSIDEKLMKIFITHLGVKEITCLRGTVKNYPMRIYVAS